MKEISKPKFTQEIENNQQVKSIEDFFDLAKKNHVNWAYVYPHCRKEEGKIIRSIKITAGEVTGVENIVYYAHEEMQDSQSKKNINEETREGIDLAKVISVKIKKELPKIAIRRPGSARF